MTIKIRENFGNNKGAKKFCNTINELQKSNKVIKNTTKSVFMEKVESIKKKCFMDIEDMCVDKACQRETFSKRRETSFINIAKTFDPRKFGRVIIGRLPEDTTNYVVDGLGRTSVALALGFESLPVEILKFGDRGEMLSYFLSQHDDQTKISNWERYDVIRQTSPLQKNLYLKHWNQAQDIERIMKKHKLVYDDSKSDWDHFWKRATNISVERAYTAIRQCIVSKHSGQYSAKAGDRMSIVLDEALRLYKEHFISKTHLSVTGNALIVMCVFLSHKKWSKVDQEPTKILDLKKGYESNVKEIGILNQRVKELDDFLSKLSKMSGEEFFSHACDGLSKTAKLITTEVARKLKDNIRSARNPSSSTIHLIDLKVRASRNS